MRKFIACSFPALARCVHLPWNTTIGSSSNAHFKELGISIIDVALSCDTGVVAFKECCSAREQLEMITQSIGYDMNIYIFGGLVTMGLLEAGGDIDFVGVADIEPEFEEAGDIVVRVSRELRRLGLKTWALPKARVPLVKGDRVSRPLPGSPLHSISSDGIFQFSRQVTPNEACSFEKRVRENYYAREVDWNSTQQFATVQFESTSQLIHAVTQIKHHENVDIPLRLPVDVRDGPELYRFPFDFCLSPTGLRNSYLLSEALAAYPYSRHLLLVLKKWGRASGVINSVDGLLASYALTVMFTHFLIRVGVVPKVSSLKMVEEPQLLQMNPEYRPLSGDTENAAEVGFLFAAFLEYFGSIFNYNENVVCTTKMNLTKKKMHWDRSSAQDEGKPPHFFFAIKDPYGLDNIARNLDRESASYVKEAHAQGLSSLMKNITDPSFAFSKLLEDPPLPARTTRSLSERGIQSSVLSPDQLEARHVLNKVEFHERKKSIERLGKKAVANSENQNAATNVTKSVLSWIKSDEH